MSVSLTVATVIEKNKIAGSVPFIVCLDVSVQDSAGVFVESIKVANNPEPITVQGEVFEKGAFSIDIKQETGAQADITLSLYDYSKTVINQMNKYGGGVGFKVKMLVVNTSQLDELPEIIEYFEIIGATAKEYAVSLTLGAENFLIKQVPGRTQLRDFCSWDFKDTNCGYLGEQLTCDRSFAGTNGCRAKNNAANFGGFPGIIARAGSYV